MSRRIFVVAASLTLAALGACVGTRKPEAPPALLEPTRLGLGLVAAAPADERWWLEFQDPQLDRLMQAALRDNPTLAEAGARLKLAQAQSATERAGTLPSVSLSGGETRTRVPSGFPEALAGGKSVWVGDLGVALSWDLDLWGRQAALVAAARGDESAARLDIDGARTLVAGAVTQAYLDLYRSHALADIAQQAEAQRRNILQITQRRVAAGLDTRVELRLAEAAVPQAQRALTQAQSAQALAIHQLALLAGQGAGSYADFGAPQLDPDAALVLPVELPLNLLARRPDVLAARARVDAYDAQRRAARAAFYPSIGLRALAGFASFSLQDLLGASSFGYGAGGSVALPLFDAGRLRAQLHGADSAVESSVASYNDTVLHAVKQAADQLTLVDALQVERAQQQQSLDADEEAYALAERRYRAGLTNYLVVLNAETQLLDARRQRVELQAGLAQARVSLLLAVGGSFSPPATAIVAARQ